MCTNIRFLALFISILIKCITSFTVWLWSEEWTIKTKTFYLHPHQCAKHKSMSFAISLEVPSSVQFSIFFELWPFMHEPESMTCVFSCLSDDHELSAQTFIFLSFGFLKKHGRFFKLFRNKQMIVNHTPLNFSYRQNSHTLYQSNMSHSVFNS